MMMNFPRFTGFEHNANLSPLKGVDQVMMDCATGNHGAQWNSRLRNFAIAKNNKGESILDSLGGFDTDSIEGCLKSLVFCHLISDVNKLGAHALIVHLLNIGKLPIGEYWMLET